MGVVFRFRPLFRDLLDNEELEIVCLSNVAQFYVNKPQVLDHVTTMCLSCDHYMYLQSCDCHVISSIYIGTLSCDREVGKDASSE